MRQIEKHVSQNLFLLGGMKEAMSWMNVGFWLAYNVGIYWSTYCHKSTIGLHITRVTHEYLTEHELTTCFERHKRAPIPFRSERLILDI